MPFILDREIDPLYQEGVEKGKAEATKETKIDIAKTMLAQNLPLDMIASVTGLNQEEIEKLLPDETKTN